ncbi:ABC transporter substrate-binding protein [Paenibacillus cremeus]|uniref:Probable sugar-binding periplasmic protein n=1 Tax=Paenibacillus cremeus TaxID=2163881 RepID=A0A559K7V3_9BACL|nr:extracellular solute-binding protein [Paenibacillus cremeus]TVY08198.1 extracellular solute-binding protein [Paenibacillus cremeus]
MRTLQSKSKILRLTAVIAGIAMLGAGCSSSGSDSSAGTGSSSGGTGSTGAAAKTELNVMIMTEANGDQTEAKVWEDTVKLYGEKNPNVKINLQLQNFGGVEQHRTWVTTQLIGGNAPDIFTTRYIWDQEDLKKGLLVDLTPYYSKKNPYLDNKSWEEVFPKSMLTRLIGDGKSYASVPTNVDSVRILYNKDLFAKAGIQNIPKTWNEFLDAQEKLKKAGITPFGFPNTKPGDYNYSWTTRILTEELIANQYDQMDVNKSGFIEVNEYARAVDQGLVDITKSPYKDVFPIIKNWSQYWAKGFNGIDFDTSTDMFLRGDVAMIMRTSGQSKVVYESSARKFEVAAFPLPYLTKENHPDAVGKLMEIGGVPAGNMAIPKTIKPEKLDAAVDFMAFLTSPKIQGMHADKLYRNPATSTADLPDKLKGFLFTGDPMKLNIYGGEVDKNVTENNQKLGQLYLEGSLQVDKYLTDLKRVMVDGVKQKKDENKWSAENNYGIK